MKLNGKVAIVTGAGSGIGRAISLTFAREGASLLVVDINLESANETTQLIKESVKMDNAVSFQADVADPENAEAIVKAAIEHFGQLDILVNNAGVGGMGSVVDIDYAEWRRVTSIDMDSVYLLSNRAIPAIQKSGKGRIINIASAMGLIAHKASAPYSAAKAAVVHLTRQMALDFGENQITVNAICPGIIHTPLIDPAVQMDIMREWYIKKTPLKRLGKPEDVANLALFLASDESDFITGAAIPIDGGITSGTDVLHGPFAVS